jgi:molybdopterin-guanine dinucleotide biosynthesis protein A
MFGAILAGGTGRRMGGGKAAQLLAGRPLASYPAQTLVAACARVAIVAKASSELPTLPGVTRWNEPDEPLHPLAGIVHALGRAGQPVLVCAADMPFVTVDACDALIAAVRPPATVATCDGRLQPVFAIYTLEALDVLLAAPPDAPLTRTVESLAPQTVELPADVVRSVDTAEALAAASESLAASRGTPR